MGINIDAYHYDYEKLCQALEKLGVKDRELLDVILDECGTRIADRYVLINNEYWDGFSPYYNVSSVIDRVFNIEDSFGEVFCTLDDNLIDRKTVPTGVVEDDVIDKVMRIKLGTEKP
jgi:hypothetical protein